MLFTEDIRVLWASRWATFLDWGERMLNQFVAIAPTAVDPINKRFVDRLTQ